ncbi:AraC family transcriptional regulator [Gordonibacter sp. An230]|uniref:AraC family transcriptional regulator n=1 Tax=Gordonibacter sp. An230 TaxID=1965592 RepID=UPI0013A65372|nr:helix-turn-helix domain-containing protein [Gordonibacter sp. An230]
MRFKQLQIGPDLRETIPYGESLVPLCACVDRLDEYLSREWSFHWHDEVEFAVVRRGAVRFTVRQGDEGVAINLREGDGIVINSGRLHSVRSKASGTELTGFAVPPAFIERLYNGAESSAVRPVVESGMAHAILRADNEDAALLLETMREIFEADDGPCGELRLIELACRAWRLFANLIIKSDEAAPRTGSRAAARERNMKKMLSYVHAHFREAIGVDDIARSAAVSRTECFRCFRSALGETPTEYLSTYRLSAAASLLAGTTRPIADIASSCGFGSSSYFGKLFRARYGKTPRDYRELAQRKGPASV